MTLFDSSVLNTLRPRQNGRHFADDIFKCIFLNENVSIAIKISLKFVPNGPINNIPALVKIMAWRRSGDKPLSEPMMVSLPTHICGTRPEWVKLGEILQTTYIFTYWFERAFSWVMLRLCHCKCINSKHMKKHTMEIYFQTHFLHLLVLARSNYYLIAQEATQSLWLNI